MDDLLSLLAKLRAAERQSNANKVCTRRAATVATPGATLTRPAAASPCSSRRCSARSTTRARSW
jgi:hypothetical protein